MTGREVNMTEADVLAVSKALAGWVEISRGLSCEQMGFVLAHAVAGFLFGFEHQARPEMKRIWLSSLEAVEFASASRDAFAGYQPDTAGDAGSVQ